MPDRPVRIGITPKSDRPLANDRLVLVSDPDVSFIISNSRLGNFRQPNRMHLNFLSSPRRRALFL
ncbi:MAG: hypothetical protein GDA43_03680 [Hormoscilla sp. SP5CHS1]|nr:hypothetical protein [Hormoscilla sp. SP12CHS1]MBC6452400.1 hypothetical protein [Hormoscilla sp. SP5CHS1]